MDDSTRRSAATEQASLLHYLGYDDGNPAAVPNRVRLLNAAARLRRLFLLPVPDAPGLTFFGGEADPAAFIAEAAPIVASLAGSGLTPQRAFESCVGEGIEYVSRSLHAADLVADMRIADALVSHDRHGAHFVATILAASGFDPPQRVQFVQAKGLNSGGDPWFPVDLCLRRATEQQDFAAPLKLSTGCAAAADMDEAILRALLELIERDAAALWWRGGRRGRSVPEQSEAGSAASALLKELRQGQTGRRTWLLNITSDLGIPVIVALSTQTDGFGLAYGFGARTSLHAAAQAAIFEMCQVELGQHVIAAKRRESGDLALNESDLRQLRRAHLLDSRKCVLLQALPAPDTEPDALPTDPVSATGAILTRLDQRGIKAYSLDLTRPEIGVPVVRVLAPGLQPEPCPYVSERLAHVAGQTGGAGLHTQGLPLLGS
jgi:ribosomal protein S12 methylthiotransferase accessory factor